MCTTSTITPIVLNFYCFFFFFQAEDGIRDYKVTGVQTCALPILRPGLAFLALLGAVTVPRAAAQAPALTVIVQSGVPRVQTTGLLADGKFVGLLRSGFPLRLHYRLELWRSRSGWFDQYISEASWDAVARHDPLADDFVLIRTGGSVTRYGTPDDLERGLELPYRVNLKVKGSGNFYFLCRLDVTTLNDTDL